MDEEIVPMEEIRRLIKSILENKLDEKPLPIQLELLSVTHDNIRGADYYNDERTQHVDTTDR